MAEGKEIDAGIIQRVVSGVKDTAAAVKQIWFGPGTPMKPAAPETAGRRYDYQPGANYNITPRANNAGGTSFAELRSLADSCTVLRSVIETRKDQIEALPWDITPIDKDDETSKEAARHVRECLRYPVGSVDWRDTRWTFRTWLRALLEDLFVLDAPAIEPRLTRGGDLYSLDHVDGATIIVRLDGNGRTPAPPDPAYQQILKGIPANDLTADQIIYFPRNPRTNRDYGFGPVEQIIFIVNLALRRDIQKLYSYTEGTIPESVAQAPASWTFEQVEKFQGYWNTYFEGNQSAKSKVKWVPGGTIITGTKETVLKDEFDEWLARVICFVFSISPQPFIKDVNRATAETAQQTARNEGLIPLMLWIKDLLDLIIQKYMKQPGLEFSWKLEEQEDPQKRATSEDLEFRSGRASINELRARRGMAPIDGGDVYLVTVGSALVPVRLITDTAIVETGKPEPFGQPPQEGGGTMPGQPTTSEAGSNGPLPSGGELPKPEELDAVMKLYREALSKKKKPSGQILKAKPDPLQPEAVKRLAAIVRYTLATVAKDVAAQVVALVKPSKKEKIAKAEDLSEAEIKAIMRQLDLSGLEVLATTAGDELSEAMRRAGKAALMQVVANPSKELFNVVDQRLVAWAKDRGAELVGKKWINGVLVDNPNAEWVIADSTRDLLRSDIVRAVTEGFDPVELKELIEQNYGFSAQRAENIALTEISLGQRVANMEGWRASEGVTHKRSVLSSDHDDALDCECGANAEQDWIPFDDNFQDGNDGYPFHPHCFCDVEVMVTPQETEDQSEDPEPAPF